MVGYFSHLGVLFLCFQTVWRILSVICRHQDLSWAQDSPSSFKQSCSLSNLQVREAAVEGPVSVGLTASCSASQGLIFTVDGPWKVPIWPMLQERKGQDPARGQQLLKGQQTAMASRPLEKCSTLEIHCNLSGYRKRPSLSQIHSWIFPYHKDWILLIARKKQDKENILEIFLTTTRLI